MKPFWELKRSRSVGDEHISVAFAPWRICNFCDDVRHFGVCFVKTVIKGHGIERVAEITNLGEDPNRPARATTGFGFYAVSYRFVEREVDGAEVRLSPKSEKRGRPCREKSTQVKKR